MVRYHCRITGREGVKQFIRGGLLTLTQIVTIRRNTTFRMPEHGKSAAKGRT